MDRQWWESKNEQINIFNNEKSVGALIISCYTVPAKIAFDIEQELHDFADSIDKEITAIDKIIKGDTFASWEISINHQFWKI